MKMTYKSFYNFFQINIYFIITKDTWQLPLNDKHRPIEYLTSLLKKQIKNAWMAFPYALSDRFPRYLKTASNPFLNKLGCDLASQTNVRSLRL